MSSSLLIRGGRVIDPSMGTDAVLDVAVVEGRIDRVGESLPADGFETIDATRLIVTPGLIDVHVHLRVPGQEHKETIATGTAAAAAGGFTAICCMPNTQPALDSVAVLAELQTACERDAVVPVHPIAAITRGRAGSETVDFDALAAAGAIGFSDDGDTTADSATMRSALEASARTGKPVMVHCEDKALAHGAMHEGVVSAELGRDGIPAEAEEIVIARDLLLARLTGGWLHVLHVSTRHGIEMIERAKADGVRVTAEVMPHHLTMDDGWVAGRQALRHTDYPERRLGLGGPDPNAKVNPPLRTPGDARGLLDALKRGAFDVVATDHAPHAAGEKARPFAEAPFGLSGLEFALPLMLGLHRAGHLSLRDLVSRMSTEPARLFGLPGGSLAPGCPADITIIDPDAELVVDAANLKTKSANTPLLGMTMRGRAARTIVAGTIRHRI